jgi:hypothetical protein
MLLFIYIFLSLFLMLLFQVNFLHDIYIIVSSYSNLTFSIFLFLFLVILFRMIEFITSGLIILCTRGLFHTN